MLTLLILAVILTARVWLAVLKVGSKKKTVKTPPDPWKMPGWIKDKTIWKWIIGILLLAGGIWWAVGNLPHDWFANILHWPHWPLVGCIALACFVIWILTFKRLRVPVILGAGLGAIVYLGWLWHNMPPTPEPAVEFPGEIQGAIPMSFEGKKFLEVNPNQVVIVNTEGGVIVRQEGFDILDNLPQNQKFPQGKIWYWVDLKDVAPYSGSAKYLDPWDSKKKAEEFKLKSGNAIVGYRVRGFEPKKLAIFIPLNKD